MRRAVINKIAVKALINNSFLFNKIIKYQSVLCQKVITDWVSAIVSYILTLPLSHYAD